MRLASSLCALVCFLSLAAGVTGCAADVEPEEEMGATASEAKKKKGNDVSRRFDVLQHNVGGDAENDGGAAGVAYTFGRIDATKPDVVMLEEVCQAQADAFIARYPGWSVLYAPMTTNAGEKKCGGTPKGQLLASPRPMTEAIRKDLGDPDGPKVFTLLCGEIAMPDTARKVLACVTHLRAAFGDREATEPARDRQAWRIADTLDPLVAKGQPVVVAGDFNAGPGRKPLDHLYRITRNGKPGGGKFDEADQANPSMEKLSQRDEVTCAPDACRTGEGTMTSNNSKLDYVFFSHNRVAGGLRAELDGGGGSGHLLYRASARLDF